MKSLVAAGDRSLFLSTPAQLDASTGFVVPLTQEQPQEIPGSLVVSPACPWSFSWDELWGLSCPDSPQLKKHSFPCLFLAGSGVWPQTTQRTLYVPKLLSGVQGLSVQ